MPSARKLGLVGAALGVLTAGTGAAVAVASRRAGAQRRAPEPDAVTEARFGALRADRSYTVVADDGIRLHVEEVGPLDAEWVVIFVHGYTLALGSWHFQRLALARPGLRLVFYDLRSHGRSERASADSCELDQLGHDLAAVLGVAAGDRPTVLVGHSMGGMTIMALAEQFPDLFGGQVTGVALLSTTTGGLADVDLGLPRVLAPLKLVMLPMLARGMRARPRLAEFTRRTGSDLSWWLTKSYSFGNPAVSPALVDYVGELIAATPVEVIADFFATLMGHDTVRSLPALSGVDTLIVCGEADRLTPLAHSRAMKDALPAARLVVVPGAGHLAMMEQPDPVNDALRTLLDRLAGSTVNRNRRA
ncbi:MAG: alpha/beta hydrolase [Geodermatophilaceae bacterium]|nr:alpha/beta hydrolase [Geodermatophilaceae bacterium]